MMCLISSHLSSGRGWVNNGCVSETMSSINLLRYAILVEINKKTQLHGEEWFAKWKARQYYHLILFLDTKQEFDRDKRDSVILRKG